LQQLIVIRQMRDDMAHVQIDATCKATFEWATIGTVTLKGM